MIRSQLHRAQYRIPLPLADWLKARAEKNYRSVNAEVVEILRCAQLHDLDSNEKSEPVKETSRGET